MPSVPGTAAVPLGGGVQGDFGVNHSNDFNGVRGGRSGSSTAML